MKLSYKNVTISGGVGVGTSTLLRNLQPHLEPLGFTLTSIGEMMREVMNEQKNPLAELMPDNFHREVEQKTHDMLKSGEPYVIEGWLTGFIARKFDHTLRVLLFSSNDDVRIDRVVNRDNVSVEKAKEIIHDREARNFKLWKELYGNYEFWSPKYYQLRIDTHKTGPQETVKAVVDMLTSKN